MRARETELHAGREPGVEVEVVVLGGDGLVDLREHGREPLRRRRRRGHEAHLAAALLEGAVGDEGVQVHEQPEVAAESLDHHEHAGVQRLHRGQPVALLRRPPHVLHHRPRQPLRDLRQQRPVIPETHRQRPLEGQHPLSIADRGEHVVD